MLFYIWLLYSISVKTNVIDLPKKKLKITVYSIVFICAVACS